MSVASYSKHRRLALDLFEDSDLRLLLAAM
jgi:hypothetical protein